MDGQPRGVVVSKIGSSASSHALASLLATDTSMLPLYIYETYIWIDRHHVVSMGTLCMLSLYIRRIYRWIGTMWCRLARCARARRSSPLPPPTPWPL